MSKQKCMNVRVNEFPSDIKMAMHDSHFNLPDDGESAPPIWVIVFQNIHLGTQKLAVMPSKDHGS